MKSINNLIKNIWNKITTTLIYKILSKKIEEMLDVGNRDTIRFDISIIAVFSSVILTILGFLYLKYFFSEFKIPYERYFNIIDCINALYIKSSFYYYTISFLALISISLFLLFISQVKMDNKKKKLYTFLYILFSCIIYIYALFKAEDEKLSIKAFSIFTYIILILILWFINYKYIAIAIISFVFTGLLSSSGREDAKKIINSNKANNKFNVILKGNDTILRDNDPNRYFIYKTTDFIFLIQEDTIKQKKNGIDYYYIQRKYISKPTSEIQELSSINDTIPLCICP